MRMPKPYVFITKISALLVFIFLSGAAKLYPEVDTAELTIKFEGILTDKGMINVALCSTPEQYYSDEDIFKAVKIDPVTPRTELVLKNIPSGKYAVKAFHDENLNGILDRGFLGIPKERYGFSNNPSIRGRMPSFERSSFSVDSEKVGIMIDMR